MIAVRALAMAGLLGMALAGCNAILGNGVPEESENSIESGATDATQSGSMVDATRVADSNDAANDAGVTDATTVGVTDAGSLDGPTDGAADCASLDGIHACGSCSNDCTTLSNVSPTSLTCNAGRCGYECANGYADCQEAGSGCATPLGSVKNCGACGVVCEAGTPVCAMRGDSGAYACSNGCPTGQSNCSGTCANLTNDPNNCRACGMVCSPANATAGCTSSTCTVAACNTGFADCNGMEIDGCEVNTRTNDSNCGACGHSCTGNQTCQSGTCACPSSLPNTCSGTCVNFSNDPNNCGRCGHGCLAGGTCSGGKCQPITVVSASVAVDVGGGFATDGTNVVWAGSINNTINQVSNPGGSKTVLVNGSPVSSPVNIALSPSSGDVYWVQQGGQLGHTVLGGGATASIIAQQTGNVSGISADNSGAYYLISTGGSIEVFNTLSSGITFTQWGTSCGCSSSQASATLAGAGGTVFGDLTDQRVIVVNTGAAGSSPVLYPISSQANANYLTTDSNFAYWGAGSSTFSIARATLNAPTTAQTVVSNTGSQVMGVATDGTNLYYIQNGNLYYVNVANAVAAGGSVSGTAMTSHPAGSTTLTAIWAGGAIYYYFNGQINKIAPP